MPPLRSASGERGIKTGDGVMLKELGGMMPGDNDVGKSVREWKKDPKATVMKMLRIPSKGDKDGDGVLQKEIKKETKSRTSLTGKIKVANWAGINVEETKVDDPDQT